MSLLDTILRASNAESCIENFKKFNIDAFTLKILSDEDLQLIGVADKETRASILEHVGNVNIPSEKTVDITIDRQYMLLVLNQISLQLHRHYVCLSVALNRRDDTVICDIKLTDATRCLAKCVQLLDARLNEFNEKIVERRTRKKTVGIGKVVGGVIAVATLASLVVLFYGAKRVHN